MWTAHSINTCGIIKVLARAMYQYSALIECRLILTIAIGTYLGVRFLRTKYMHKRRVHAVKKAPTSPTPKFWSYFVGKRGRPMFYQHQHCLPQRIKDWYRVHAVKKAPTPPTPMFWSYFAGKRGRSMFYQHQHCLPTIQTNTMRAQPTTSWVKWPQNSTGKQVG